MSVKTKLAILGSGPAGYTAAIYAARAQLNPILFTGLESGGQLMYTSVLENYPGFPNGIRAVQLMMNLRQQAEKFGCTIKDQLVSAVDFHQTKKSSFKLWTQLPSDIDPNIYKNADADQIQNVIDKIKKEVPDFEAEAVIIATGATAIKLNISGEDKFFGQGVSTCAVCDSSFYKDKIVYVIGGGDSAMEDSLALANFAQKVIIIHRRHQFRASRIMQERVFKNKKIDILWESQIKKIQGQNKIETIQVESHNKSIPNFLKPLLIALKTSKNQAGQKIQELQLKADGVFLAIGHLPVSQLFVDQLALDKKGYLITRQSASQAGLQAAQHAIDENALIKYPTMTSIAGIFAAGDVVDLQYKQAITAAGSGCMAAIDAEKWLNSIS